MVRKAHGRIEVREGVQLDRLIAPRGFDFRPQIRRQAAWLVGVSRNDLLISIVYLRRHISVA
jgi:hypothetical protein